MCWGPWPITPLPGGGWCATLISNVPTSRMALHCTGHSTCSWLENAMTRLSGVGRCLCSVSGSLESDAQDCHSSLLCRSRTALRCVTNTAH